jgi:hypothetical protein
MGHGFDIYIPVRIRGLREIGGVYPLDKIFPETGI